MNADVFEAVCAMGDAARTAQSQLAQANTEAKNQLLNAIADALDQHADDIAAANTLDMNQAETDGMDAGKPDSNSTSSASPPPRKAYATWHPYQTPSAKSYADTIWKTAYDCSRYASPSECSA